MFNLPLMQYHQAQFSSVGPATIHYLTSTFLFVVFIFIVFSYYVALFTYCTVSEHHVKHELRGNSIISFHLRLLFLCSAWQVTSLHPFKSNMPILQPISEPSIIVISITKCQTRRECLFITFTVKLRVPTHFTNYKSHCDTTAVWHLEKLKSKVCSFQKAECKSEYRECQRHALSPPRQLLPVSVLLLSVGQLLVIFYQLVDLWETNMPPWHWSPTVGAWGYFLTEHCMVTFLLHCGRKTLPEKQRVTGFNIYRKNITQSTFKLINSGGGNGEVLTFLICPFEGPLLCKRPEQWLSLLMPWASSQWNHLFKDTSIWNIGMSDQETREQLMRELE